MPDPTPLSPLAGIEQMLDAYRDAVFQNGKVYGLDSVSHYHEQDDADEEAPRKAILDYLAGLGKVLEEWREAVYAASDGEHNDAKDVATLAAARLRLLDAQRALYTYLTSPRETVGKEKE